MSVTVLKRLRVKVLDEDGNPTNLLTQKPNGDIGKVPIDANGAIDCCRKIDGGAPDTVYLPWQNVDGGAPSTTHYPGQKYDGGLMALGKVFDGGLLTQ